MIANDLNNFTFSIRTMNCLNSAGFDSMDSLLEYVDEHGIDSLVRFRNFGRRSTEEVRELLNEQGFYETDPY